MPHWAHNKMPAAVKRRYMELIRDGHTGSQAARRVGVSTSCGSLWFLDAGGVTVPEPGPISSRFMSQDDRIAIADGLREGRPVTPDDIFRTMQPMMRDLAPLFDRIRVRGEMQRIEQLSGEIARKYDLAPGQQDALKKFFEARSEENARQWNALVSQDGTRLEDLAKAAHETRPDDGLDEFMERTITGDKLARFKAERMTERVERLQRDADARTERLDSIVGLDDAQRDQVFGMMAKSSPDFDPAMKLEGATGEISTTAGGNPREAMLSILRPDQRAAYETERQQRREQAAKDIEAIGLTLPADWDPLDMENF